MPLYLGQGFEESIGLMSILAFILIFIGWGNVLRTQYMLPAGYDGLYTRSVVYASVANIVISAILVIPFGTYGVAIASLSCEMIICIYSTVKLKNELPVAVFLKENCKYVFFGAIMFIVVRMENVFMRGNGIGVLVMDVCTGAAVYISLVLLSEKWGSNKLIIPECKNLLNKMWRKKNETH